MINYYTFRKDIDEKQILNNGRRTFKDGSVASLRTKQEEDGSTNVKSNVQSETNLSVHYEIDITIEANGELSDYSCDCPYFRRWGGQICKHVIAVMYYIEQEKIIKPKIKTKEETKKKKPEEQKTIVDTSVVGVDFVFKELECQVCLDILKKPIMMPCFQHSLCNECLKKLLITNKKIKRTNEVSCPTCSDKAGIFPLIDGQEFKTNKELERVIEAYKKERNIWSGEKTKLLNEINELKANNSGTTMDELANKNKEELEQIIKKCQELKKTALKAEKKQLKEAKKEEKKEIKKRRMEVIMERKIAIVNVPGTGGD